MEYRIKSTIDNQENNRCSREESFTKMIYKDSELIEVYNGKESLIGIFTSKVIKALALKILKYSFDNLRKDTVFCNLIKETISYCDKIIYDPEFIVKADEHLKIRDSIFKESTGCFLAGGTSQEYTLLYFCQVILEIIVGPDHFYYKNAFYMIDELFPEAESDSESIVNEMIYQDKRTKLIIDFFKSNEYLFHL